MDTIALKYLLAVYIAMSALNVIVAVVQYQEQQHRAHLLTLIFWIFAGIGVSTSFFIENTTFLLAALMTSIFFLAQILLASIFAAIINVPIYLKKVLFIFIADIFAGGILCFLQVDFQIYATVMTTVAALSFPWMMIQILRGYPKELTKIQKTFIVFAGLHALFTTTWSQSKTSALSALLGLSFVFGLLHILSVLISTMLKERDLIVQNQNLKNEIKSRLDELQAANLKVIESEKLSSLGRMARGVAHEVNNPLAIIALHADILKKQLQKEELELSKERVLGAAVKIREMVSRITKIVNTLKKVSREEDSLDRSVFDIHQIISENLAQVHHRLEVLGIKVTTFFNAQIHHALINKSELSQVLVNLLSNAIDAVEDLDNRWIEIRTENTDDWIQVRVVDSGKILVDLADKIMDPFFTTKEVGKGNGLGLAIAFAIIKNHNGQIYLNKQSPTTEMVIELKLVP